MSKNTKNDENYIISSEGFSFFFEFKNIIELKNLLCKFFDEVNIVTYLRRQDQFAVSFLQEASKTKNAESFMFSGTTLSLPNASSSSFYNNYFDYYKMMSRWGDVFGCENIIVKIFDKNKLKNGDVVQDFLSVVGAEFNSKNIMANESIGFESVKLGLILNQVKLNDGLEQRLRGKLAKNGVKALPSISDAKEFYNLYRKSNKMLNDKFLISPLDGELFNSDFSMYNEAPNDRWDEESAYKAIFKILDCFPSNFDLDVNAIRDAAVLLEGTNLELSMKLMKSAHLLRPNGPLIKSKLEEYQYKLNKNEGGQ